MLRLVGTDQLVTAKVTGRLGGTPLYTVDIGMPAVIRLSMPPEDVVGQELESSGCYVTVGARSAGASGSRSWRSVRLRSGSHCGWPPLPPGPSAAWTSSS